MSHDTVTTLSLQHNFTSSSYHSANRRPRLLAALNKNLVSPSRKSSSNLILDKGFAGMKPASLAFSNKILERLFQCTGNGFFFMID